MSKCNVRISRSVCSGIGVSPVGPLKTPEKHVQLGEALRTPQRINPRYCVPQRIIRSLVRLRLGNSLLKLSQGPLPGREWDAKQDGISGGSKRERKGATGNPAERSSRLEPIRLTPHSGK
jgi:hypothetical protein